MLYFILCLVVAQTVGAMEYITRDTNYGRVRGVETKLAQVFYGIPFAAPAQRWTAPEDPMPWTGTRNATEKPPMCYQTCNTDRPLVCNSEISEDCLFLNIFAPLSTKRNSKKKVVFYIHGGSFSRGTGAADLSNGEMLAKKGNIIAVTINYRLGVFGYFDTGEGNSPNYGIIDQRHALKWVNENIRGFGGDPKKVTLFGYDSGALSVFIHLTSGKVNRLFRRSITQSTAFAVPFTTSKQARMQTQTLAMFLNCSQGNVTCLRSKSSSELALLQDRVEFRPLTPSPRSLLTWFPIKDGDEVKTDILDAVRNGSFAKKPIVLGTVQGEGRYVILREINFAIPFSTLSSIIRGLAPNAPSDIFSYYPTENITDFRDTLASVAGDYAYICSTRYVARLMSQSVNTWLYVFDKALSFEGFWGSATHCENRSCHGVDVPFAFQSARRSPYRFTEDERSLSDTMISYWSGFAKTGNPNKGKGNTTRWTPYKVRGTKKIRDSALLLDGSSPLGFVKNHRSEVCDAWDTSGYK